MSNREAYERELEYIQRLIASTREAPYHHTALYWRLREKEMELLERIGKLMDRPP